MTYRPTLDSTEQTPGPPTPSSANGGQPKPALLAARDPAGVAMDAARQTADLNGGQYVVDLGAAERPVDLDAAEQAAADGVRAFGATTVTSALLGTLRTDARSRAEFFALARVPTSPAPM
jgi:hypothetical protein